ncbi:MAG: FtsH protease activity modulator HflK [Acidiferrobacterales bacterium]|nr:FtsH protease activity modulator HflK [Acidiferrobacterales bacterium]
MPWNQPGSGGGDDRDPWGQNGSRNSGNGGRRNGDRDGPPDIDEVLRDAKNRIDSLFGGRRGGGSGGSGSGSSKGGGDGVSAGAILLLLVVGLGVWGFSGFYQVDQGEQALEMRFGAYSETKDAGLRWHWPSPLETVEIVNTQNVNTVEVGYRDSGRAIQTVPREALMLTQDENIIDVRFAVQYDIKDPTKLLFNVSEYNPRDIAESVVRGATESAVREIVGRNTMDFAITEGRAQLAAETTVLLQQILDRYDTGINIRSVETQNAQPPEQVKDAFDDVVKAREDEERLKSLAQAYSNDIIPRARGAASRITQEAEAYKESIVAQAQGESARFDQILSEYAKAPEITRDRLYIESMEEVLSRSSKIVIDQQGGNSLMYLPLDQLVNRRNSSANVERNTPSYQLPSVNNNTVSSSQGVRSTSRSVDRGGRN